MFDRIFRGIVDSLFYVDTKLAERANERERLRRELIAAERERLRRELEASAARREASLPSSTENER